jgi:hypothetical protein
MARDAMWSRRTDGAGYQMSIEVRNDAGPVLQVKFTFEVHQHRH